jgi:hypothetical protein
LPRPDKSGLAMTRACHKIWSHTICFRAKKLLETGAFFI